MQSPPLDHSHRVIYAADRSSTGWAATLRRRSTWLWLLVPFLVFLVLVVHTHTTAPLASFVRDHDDWRSTVASWLGSYAQDHMRHDEIVSQLVATAQQPVAVSTIPALPASPTAAARELGGLPGSGRFPVVVLVTSSPTDEGAAMRATVRATYARYRNVFHPIHNPTGSVVVRFVVGVAAHHLSWIKQLQEDDEHARTQHADTLSTAGATLVALAREVRHEFNDLWVVPVSDPSINTEAAMTLEGWRQLYRSGFSYQWAVRCTDTTFVRTEELEHILHLLKSSRGGFQMYGVTANTQFLRWTAAESGKKPGLTTHSVTLMSSMVAFSQELVQYVLRRAHVLMAVSAQLQAPDDVILVPQNDVDVPTYRFKFLAATELGATSQDPIRARSLWEKDQFLLHFALWMQTLGIGTGASDRVHATIHPISSDEDVVSLTTQLAASRYDVELTQTWHIFSDTRVACLHDLEQGADKRTEFVSVDTGTPSAWSAVQHTALMALEQLTVGEERHSHALPKSTDRDAPLFPTSEDTKTPLPATYAPLTDTHSHNPDDSLALPVGVSGRFLGHVLLWRMLYDMWANRAQMGYTPELTLQRITSTRHLSDHKKQPSKLGKEHALTDNIAGNSLFARDVLAGKVTGGVPVTQVSETARQALLLRFGRVGGSPEWRRLRDEQTKRGNQPEFAAIEALARWSRQVPSAARHQYLEKVLRAALKALADEVKHQRGSAEAMRRAVRGMRLADGSQL